MNGGLENVHENKFEKVMLRSLAVVVGYFVQAHALISLHSAIAGVISARVFMSVPIVILSMLPMYELSFHLITLLMAYGMAMVFKHAMLIHIILFFSVRANPRAKSVPRACTKRAQSVPRSVPIIFLF